MKRTYGIAGLLLCALIAGCSGGTATPSQSQANGGNSGSGSGAGNTSAPLALAGKWQFTAASTKHQGFNTVVEANVQQSGSILTASGANQLLIIAENPSGPAIVGGNCKGSAAATLTGNVNQAVLSMTLDEGEAVFSIDANASADGRNMTGTYQVVSGDCADTGTFTGSIVQPLIGTYSGPLTFPDGTTDSVSANLIAGSGSSLSASVQVVGADNGSLTMTGTDIGDAFSLAGTFQGLALTFFGFHDASSSSIGVYDSVTGQFLGTLRSGVSAPVPTANTPTFVQLASFTAQLTSSSSLASATFANKVNAGDLLAVAFWSNNPDRSCAVPVSDSAGNTYKLVSGTSPAEADAVIVCLYTAISVAGGRNLAVTIDPGYNLQSGFAMAAMEYSGVTTVDAFSAMQGAEMTVLSATSGPALTHYPNELVLGVLMADAKFQAGSGFTSRFTSNYFIVEDKFVQAAGSYEATFESPQPNQGIFWDAAMAAFH